MYKSSARNAMRVARTETNMAYRKADNERWGQMDFVLGQRIALSKSHPAEDICDELAGDYPVDFEFTGWHPQCFCVATPILPDEDEMRKVTAAAFRGETYTPKGNRVTEYPKAFRDWVTANKTKIAAARAAGSEPYFLRNNKAAVDGILNPSKKAQTTLDKAAARHTARIPEQVAAIQKAWDERKAAHQQIRTDATAMLARAQDYGEVDWAAMDKAIASGDLMGMEAQTKSLSTLLANMDAQEAALGKLIPDAHKWHKQFTLTELQAVYDSVEKKLASLSGLSLEDKAKKLQFETDYVKNPSAYKHGATKYKTWEVALSAYEKELAAVNYEIGLKSASMAMDAPIQYALSHPKLKKLAGLINAAQKAIGKKYNLADINATVAAAVKEYQKHISATSKVATKPWTYDPDAYTKERKDNAIWAKTTSEADAKLRDKCGEVWRAATKAQKDALFGYTESYHNINEPLRGLTYYGSKSSTNLGLRRIPEITTVIDKSSNDFDMWVQRGDTRIALKKFGLANYATATDSEIKALVGKTGTEGAFWSAGVAKGKGFGGEIIFNIYMPKGTKAMYMEPFSFFW